MDLLASLSDVFPGWASCYFVSDCAFGPSQRHAQIPDGRFGNRKLFAFRSSCFFRGFWLSDHVASHVGAGSEWPHLAKVLLFEKDATNPSSVIHIPGCVVCTLCPGNNQGTASGYTLCLHLYDEL